jgi:hypothetical protein
MGLTADQKFLLNNVMGEVANKVALGDLIDGLLDGIMPSGSISTAEIANSAITADKLASDAVETLKIKNANVTLAKLAAGIAPSHVAKFAGTFTTLGGDAAESIPVVGALATDIVVVTVKTKGAAAKSIVAAAAATDAIDVTMSDDPSSDHVLQYVVFRAVS